VSTGFWECTKAGATTYWCDAGSCQPKLKKKQPDSNLHRAPRNNQLLNK
jgi:hypothetical protein